MNKQHIENLQVAWAIMFALPSERIYLEAIRKPDVDDESLQAGCGVACVAGWLSFDSFFKKQGLYYKGMWVYNDASGSASGSLWGMSEYLFGVKNIFLCSETKLSDKREALQRIRLALLGQGALSPQENTNLIEIEERF